MAHLGSLGHQGGEEPLDVLLPTQRLLVVEGLRMQSFVNIGGDDDDEDEDDEEID